METRPQFLRELPPSAERKAVAEMRQWLGTLAGKPASHVLANLASRIVPCLLEEPSLPMRLKLLEEVDGEADRVLAAQERQVQGAVIPLSTDASAAVRSADRLLQVLAQAYCDIVGGIQPQKLTDDLRHLLQQALRRAIQITCRRQMLAYRAYASPPASSWQLLHDLYRTALSAGLGGSDGADETLQALYVAALLLAYADPEKFPRAALAQVQAAIAGLAPLARIVEVEAEGRDAGKAAFRFLVRLDEGSPGHPLLRMPDRPPVFGNLIIDCRGIVAAINRSLCRKAGEAVQPTIDLPESALHLLLVGLGGEAGRRRFHRSHFKPRAQLAGGLDQVIAFMAAPDRASSAAASEWSVLDESPDGFSIGYVEGDTWPIEAGDLVALRRREQGSIHFCLVRRVAMGQQGQVALGLQELSSEGSVVELSGGDGGKRQAILFPRLPGYDNRAGIVVRPGDLAVGSEVVYKAANGTGRLSVGARLEASARLEFFALDRKMPAMGRTPGSETESTNSPS